MTNSEVSAENGTKPNVASSTGLFGVNIGDTVTWRYEFRGGYGRVVFLKAKVVKLGLKKCTLESRRVRGGIKLTSVLYENIKESTEYKQMLTSAGLV